MNLLRRLVTEWEPRWQCTLGQGAGDVDEKVWSSVLIFFSMSKSSLLSLDVRYPREQFAKSCTMSILSVFRSNVTMPGTPLQVREVRGFSANPRLQLPLQSTCTNFSALMWLASVHACNNEQFGETRTSMGWTNETVHIPFRFFNHILILSSTELWLFESGLWWHSVKLNSFLPSSWYKTTKSTSWEIRQINVWSIAVARIRLGH